MPVYVSDTYTPLMFYYDVARDAWVVARDSHGDDVILSVNGRVNYVPFGKWTTDSREPTVIFCQGKLYL